jgi:ABC-type polysaccharide/polyol phosphate transport system ATPase subunit
LIKKLIGLIVVVISVLLVFAIKLLESIKKAVSFKSLFKGLWFKIFIRIFKIKANYYTSKMKNPQQQSPLKSILISAKNIDVMYGSQKALDNISLDVSTNDLITIVGPNGAGKSTLIKCLLGIIKPTSGTIIRQKNLNIGYVPQSINIDKNLPLLVKDFLYLNKKPNKEKLQEIFKNIAIKPFID